MRRRLQSGAVISLFSFQDIMASVIGMLFFIVMIIALDIVTRELAGVEMSETPVTEEQLAALRQRVQRLTGEADRLRKLVVQHNEDIGIASTDERELLEEIRRLSARLATLHARTEQDDKMAVSLAEKKRASQVQQEEAKRKIEELEQRIEDLKRAQQTGRPSANVSYIIDPRGDNLEPWLVEVSEGALRVGSRDGASTVIDFQGAAHADRVRQFLAWARNQDPRTHYFVLLVKPSAVETAYEMERSLTGIGYHTGRDYLPEDWHAF